MTGIQPLVNSKGFKLFGILQIADVATTLIGFHLAGVQAEFNPVMRIFPASFGPVAGLLLGKLLLASMFMFFVYMRQNGTWNVGRLWTVVNVWFAGIVVWNLFQIVHFVAYK
jgi:Domain of unknown function (DUF5658)